MLVKLGDFFCECIYQYTDDADFLCGSETRQQCVFKQSFSYPLALEFLINGQLTQKHYRDGIRHAM